MADVSNLSDIIKQLISGTAPGQTIKKKPEADEVVDPNQKLIDLLRELDAEAAGRDDAATALQSELAWAGVGIQQGQLGVAQGQLALAQEAQAFTQEDIRNQRLLEAAGLATGPTGAIQLAYLARGEGAPQEEIASMFQNLPFVQELLQGQNVAGFGLPKQLGGPSGGGVATTGRVTAEGAAAGVTDVPTAANVGDILASGVFPRGGGGPSGAIQGTGLGITLPGKKSITRQAFGTLSQFEQEFLGALGQSETGQSAQGFLEDIIKSFIPTRAAGAVSIA